MTRNGQEKVLLIADPQHQVHAAVQAALPTASLTTVSDYFEAIAELASGHFTAVFAAADPVERRPEPAIRALRELCGTGRLILFGQPSIEGLSRKMLEHGADDYLITPASPSEIQQIFGAPIMRVVPAPSGADESAVPQIKLTEPVSTAELMASVPVTEILLDALLQHPGDAPQTAIRHLSERLAPAMQLLWQASGQPPIEVPDDATLLSHSLRVGADEIGHMHLLFAKDQDPQAARHFVGQIAHLMGKVAALQERHNRLQKLAITDQLTGVYNRRYFEHFLARIIERARTMRFPVTLLLFDIDDFKRYNDTYGHGVGDQILKETAAMMKRCSREHDLVARIGGDEFAVVFWEKEGPRQPKEKDAAKPPIPGKPPQTPQQVFDRFKRLMATQDFPLLGPSGKGTLTISGGLASFPWDGRDVAELIAAADHALVRGAKQGGKDRLFLVGEQETPPQE